MADIASVATLDSTPFTKGLNDALAASKRWRKQVLSTFDFQPLVRVNQEVEKLKQTIGSTGKLKLTINTAQAVSALQQGTVAAQRQGRALTAVQQAVLEYRNKTLGLRNAVESSLISQKEGIRLAIQFRDEALAAAKNAEMWSKEWRELMVAAGRADRTLATLEGRVTKLGLSQNVAIGTTRNLTQSYQQLAGALTAVFATAGVARYVRALVEFSGEAAEARNAVALYFTEVEKGGMSAERGAQAMNNLAARFHTTSDAAASGLTLLVRNGASLQQAMTLLERGAASALNFGRTAADGFDNMAQAIISGRSTLLNSIGISKDLSVMYREYAASVGKSVAALNEFDKMQAVVNGIVGETQSEVEALGTIYGSFIGAQNDLNTAMKNFRRSVGRGAEVFLTPLFNTLTGLLNLFNALPQPMKTAGLGIIAFAGAVAGLGIAFVTLQAVLVKTQALQTGINALLGNEIVLRSRLGAALLTLAGRYSLLTKEQVANAAAQRSSLGALTGWQIASKGVGTALGRATTALKGFTAASMRFILTPVGLVITAIAAAVGLVITAFNRFPQIVQPALTAVETAVSAVRTAFAGLTAEGTKVGDALRVVAGVLKGALITVATQTAHVIARLARAFGIVAARIQFVNDLLNVGPRQAWANYQTALEEVDKEFDKLSATITETSRAVRDGTYVIEDAGVEAKKTAAELEELAKKTKDAEKAFLGFKQQFQDIRIGLMSDGLEKDLEETRVRFLRLRDAIRETAEENEQFQPFAKQLIAESFELEQREILKLQADYADKRKAEAEKQAAELADAISTRERAIVDAQTKGRLNTIDTLRLEHQRRLEDTEKLYGDLISKAKEYGQDTKRLEELRVSELRAIQDGFAREVESAYDDLYDTLTGKQRDLLLEAAEARGDQHSVLGIKYDQELRDLTKFYGDARIEAAGNADLLALIDETAYQARRQATERYWRETTRLQQEASDQIVARERDLAKARAEFAGDQGTVIRLAAAAELREIHAAYDRLEAAAAGNAAELVRIAELRNQEVELANAKLAESITELNEEAFAAAQKPLIDAITKDLDEATSETLAGIERQLLSWRNAYGGNGEVVKMINAALERVADRHEQLADEASKHVEELIKTVRGLTEGVFSEDAQRGLSDLDQALFTAAERANALRAEQERIATALLTTVGRERDELLRTAQDVDDALAAVNRNILADAKRMTTEAVQAYMTGIEAARRDASQAAAQLVQSDVERTLNQLTALQTNALAATRTSLLRAIATLTARGFESGALDPLRQQVAEIDALMAQRARATADFASEQFQHLRDVAQATLDEAGAQRVAHATYRETIRLRKEALAEAVREAAGVEEVAAATRNVTDAQLAYISHLEDQATALQAVKGQYAGVYSAAADLAELLDQPVPRNVIESQRQLALAALSGVRAAQEAGESFAQYGDDLQDATRLWRDYQTAANTSMQAAAKALRESFTDGLVTEADAGQFRELAGRIAKEFGLGLTDVNNRLKRFIDGTITDPLEGLEVKQPDILRDIFKDLNAEAVQTPDTLKAIDEQVTSLEQQVAALKTEIASAVNFDAAGQQLISGYKAVIDEVQAVTGDVFADSASNAVTAFLKRFGDEQQRIEEELRDTIGDAADAAGEAAGKGLMTAFASGVTANKQVLLTAVEDVLHRIREMLPSSDAKRGPLSDLTHSGQMFTRTFLSGALSQRQALASGMTQLLSGLTPGAAFRAASATANAGSGSARGPVQIAVDARSTSAPGPLAQQAREFVRLVDRELDARGLKKGRR